jgi:hypothetical protein
MLHVWGGVAHVTSYVSLQELSVAVMWALLPSLLFSTRSGLPSDPTWLCLPGKCQLVRFSVWQLIARLQLSM